MNRLLKNILIGLITSVGLFVIIIVILEAMGIDTGLGCVCDRCASKNPKTPKDRSTRIRRNYTEITLPKE